MPRADAARNVLVTSAGNKLPLLRATSEALRRLNSHWNVIAGDSDSTCPASFLNTFFWHTPDWKNVGADFLIRELKERSVAIILPTRDGELDFWAEMSPALRDHGIEVIVSRSESLRVCLDKIQFAVFGLENSLPVIPTSLNFADFGDAPLVVKERYGSGSKGIGLNLSPKDAKIHSKLLNFPIFQPYVLGAEISIDAYMTLTSEVHGLVLRKRERVINGESQVTSTFRHPKIEAAATRVLSALQLRGPVVMQGITFNGGIRVIEVNPRFGGASTASIAVGLDLIFWCLFERLRPESPLPSFMRTDDNVRQVRTQEDTIFRGSYI